MYPTKEYVARDDNGNVTSRVNVYVVTDEHDGEKVQTTGGDREIRSGNVLVQADNPNYWDVFDADAFDALGYADADSSAADAPTVAPADESVPADPAAVPSADAGHVPADDGTASPAV